MANEVKILWIVTEKDLYTLVGMFVSTQQHVYQYRPRVDPPPPTAMRVAVAGGGERRGKARREGVRLFTKAVNEWRNYGCGLGKAKMVQEGEPGIEFRAQRAIRGLAQWGWRWITMKTQNIIKCNRKVG